MYQIIKLFINENYGEHLFNYNSISIRSLQLKCAKIAKQQKIVVNAFYFYLYFDIRKKIKFTDIDSLLYKCFKHFEALENIYVELETVMKFHCRKFYSIV